MIFKIVKKRHERHCGFCLFYTGLRVHSTDTSAKFLLVTTIGDTTLKNLRKLLTASQKTAPHSSQPPTKHQFDDDNCCHGSHRRHWCNYIPCKKTMTFWLWFMMGWRWIIHHSFDLPVWQLFFDSKKQPCHLCGNCSNNNKNVGFYGGVSTTMLFFK